MLTSSEFITYRQSLGCQRGEYLVARTPRERVLTETDGPFSQTDGKSMMPWGVDDATRNLGRIWDLSQASTEQVIREDFLNLSKIHMGTWDEH